MNNKIIIQDWTGRILFAGNYKDKLVDQVLDANRCNCLDSSTCKKCGDTGYSGDFRVYWQDETREDNVYEFINY